MRKFDFILFENLQSALNHYKDVCIIAKMLKDAGFRVAIATLYEEEKYCNCLDGITLLKVNISKPVPNNDWLFNTKNKLHSLFCVLRYIYQQHLYLKEFLEEIRGLSHNYYVGSYHTLTSSLLIREANENCNIYYWGLRSSRINLTWRMLFSDPVAALKLFYVKDNIFVNNNLLFFVSNEIIKQEFLNLGIASERLIIREERFYDENVSIANFKSRHFTLLSIGLLRKSKRIEMIVDAFRRVSSKDDEYLIVGRCHSDVYSNKIDSRIGNDNRIKRVKGYIDDISFNNFFDKCHYLVLGDTKEVSSVTNGTMLEALLHKRPIIAPNYDPYKYYISKFKIGLLYDDNSSDSLDNVIKLAKSLPENYFDDNIQLYLKSISYSECLKKFSKEINLSYIKRENEK